jgi:hypothetical protein
LSLGSISSQEEKYSRNVSPKECSSAVKFKPKRNLDITNPESDESLETIPEVKTPKLTMTPQHKTIIIEALDECLSIDVKTRLSKKKRHSSML